MLAGSSASPGGSDPVFTVQTYGGTPPVALRLRAYDEPAVASGSGDAVVIARLDVTASVNCLDAVTELLSVTCTANAKLPPSVGTPEMVAVPASKESPAGSPPEVMLQRYGGVPPVAASAWEYVDPAVAGGNAGADEIVSAAATGRLNCLLALRARLSLTSTVNWKEPAADGIPPSAPVDASSVTPAGKPPLLIDHT